ncbi:ribosome biogenesis GTP-binding protein YihA/YsxC [Candidatus Profftia tarda]
MHVLNYLTHNYHVTRFLKSTPNIYALLQGVGIEVAFIGRSNAGKSSAINTLSNQKSLARTSKNPGSTRLINQFEVTDGARLIDLPGYGYTLAPKPRKNQWLRELGEYLKNSQCLKGIVLLMDIRHPLQGLDQQIIQWASDFERPLILLLTKADKLTYTASRDQVNIVRKAMLPILGDAPIEAFSSLKKLGIDKLTERLNMWFSGLML